MRFFTLSPEVAGGLGGNTVMSRQEHAPVVTHLHYEFQGWLGDDLLETFPCFVITQKLAEQLQRHPLSGYELKAVEVSTSEEFRELDPDCELPDFVWLGITGTAGIDDFGVNKVGQLVVSEVAFGVLKKVQLDYCDVVDFASSPD